MYLIVTSSSLLLLLGVGGMDGVSVVLRKTKKAQDCQSYLSAF